jgi:hypothetical protein
VSLSSQPQNPAAAHSQTNTSWALSAHTSAPEHDIVQVPRFILERLLTHAVAGNRRFPTRHLFQAIQMLQHILTRTD